jgi:hypothetical protein
MTILATLLNKENANQNIHEILQQENKKEKNSERAVVTTKIAAS